MRFVWMTFLALFSIGMIGLMAGIGGAVYLISYYGKDLPDYSALKDYQPPVVTRLYAGDGSLVAEFAEEKRVFVPVEAMPSIVKNAFIAAEDQNFYEHQGVDYTAIARAVFSNVRNIGSGRRPVGASTITQQVAKNFLLTNEVSVKRKIREAILAFRMEKAMSKDRLLELYLNQIYLGEGTYGVAAAALNYFGRSLDELEIEQAAFLAALPKAPNNYSPKRHPEAALARRNWVIERMADDGYITRSQAEIATAKPLDAVSTKSSRAVTAPYFAEEIRRELVGRYGDQILYKGGLVVRSSLDPKLQEAAQKALRDGLIAYDRRHALWKGPLAHADRTTNWQQQLAEFPRPEGAPAEWRVTFVVGVTDAHASVGFEDGTEGRIFLEDLTWARPSGVAKVTSARQVLKAGDIVLTERVVKKDKASYALRRIPAINGAIIAMDPHTGRVLAMQGGWDYDQSEFNRATQAVRQPGSAFKPFIYLDALDRGFTPSTLILDAPLVIDQGPGLPPWRPTNYTGEFYGPTPLRVGVEKSRNLMTVRLAQYLGMDNIIEFAKKFGVITKMEPMLANSLGAGETTLLRLTTGYAQIVNGGKKINPTFVDRIQDREGATVFKHDMRPCDGCGPMMEWTSQVSPVIPDPREQLVDPRKAYQMTSILEGVVERGTAVRAKALGRPLAGKTGTTNESKDTWFIGFSPDLIAGVFVGFDEPKSMGKKETGASVALPIWTEFMETALKDQPAVPFRVPPGIRQVQVNADTGTRVRPGDKDVIWEVFLTGTEPTDRPNILDSEGIGAITGDLPTGESAPIGEPENPSPHTAAPVDSSTNTGTGGLY